jgi:PST family polysaccharide transporter
VVQFIIGVVLARLLPPEDFGLLGLAMIVVGFGSLFVKLGLGPALIQRQKLTDRHVRVAFTVSALAGGGLCVALIAGAPAAAWILEDARVTPILQVLAVSFVMGGLQVPSQALLQKRLDFQRIFYISISKNVTYGITSIALAIAGVGVWSLVFGNLARRTVNLVLNYASVQHRIKPLLAMKELKHLARFGAGMSMASIFNYVALQGDYFVIGRVLGAHVLGLYSRAYSLMQMPTQRFVSVLSGVLFPAASRIQGNDTRFRSAYVRTLKIIAFVTLPIMVLLVIIAPELIVGVYGEKWSGAIVPLQILGAFGLFRASYNGAASFLKAKGWVYQLLGCQITYGTVLVTTTWTCAHYFGLAGAAWAVGGSIVLMWAMVMYFGAKASRLSFGDVVKTLQPGFVISMILGVLTFGVRYSLMEVIQQPLLLAGGTTLVAVCIAIGAIFALPQGWLGHVPHEALKAIEDNVPTRYATSYDRLRTYFQPKESAIIQ